MMIADANAMVRERRYTRRLVRAIFTEDRRMALSNADTLKKAVRLQAASRFTAEAYAMLEEENRQEWERHRRAIMNARFEESVHVAPVYYQPVLGAVTVACQFPLRLRTIYQGTPYERQAEDPVQVYHCFAWLYPRVHPDDVPIMQSIVDDPGYGTQVVTVLAETPRRIVADNRPQPGDPVRARLHAISTTAAQRQRQPSPPNRRLTIHEQRRRMLAHRRRRQGQNRH